MAKGPAFHLDQIRHYAARNAWVVGRDELRALGCPARRIDSWLESERLIPLFRKVYAFGRDIETAESAWRGALLAAGPGSVLAGRTACELWGLVRRINGIPTRIQVASQTRQAALFLGRSEALARTRVHVVNRKMHEADMCRRERLAVMSAPLAVMDYARDADQVAVRFAFLEACRLGLFGRSDLEPCFERIEGMRGASRVRPLLRLWVPELGQVRSVLEGLFLLAWIKSDNRMPLVNRRVCGFEVDCFWPEQHLVVELDGASYHSDPLARKRDAEKESALVRGGLRVARFSYREVRDQTEMVVRSVGRLLDRA